MLCVRACARKRVCVCALTRPHEYDVTQGHLFYYNSAGFNSDFSFSYTCCHTQFKELSVPNILPIARERIVGCMLFPRLSAVRVLQRTSFRN